MPSGFESIGLTSTLYMHIVSLAVLLASVAGVCSRLFELPEVDAEGAVTRNMVRLLGNGSQA